MLPNLYAWNVISHVIYYEPTKDGISIYRVLHKSMDNENIYVQIILNNGFP